MADRAGRAGLGGPVHLAGRLVEALRGGAPDVDGERRLLARLSPAEVGLYRSMSTADRRHAVRGATYVETTALFAAAAETTVGSCDGAEPSQEPPAPLARGATGAPPPWAGLRVDRRSLVAAAALHDVAKTAAGLGTAGRVAASVTALVLGRDRVARWARHGGFVGRVGRYVAHPEAGAAVLAEAGSAPVACRWAAEHHGGPAASTLPAEVVAVLAAADRR